MSQPVPLLCGLGQPGHACGQPAVGALAVHVYVGRLPAAAAPPQAGALLLCVPHLAGFNEPAEAVFPTEQQPFPPGAGTKGA